MLSVFLYMMSPQDLENYIARVAGDVMDLKTSVKSFTDTTNKITESLKERNNNEAELKGLESKLAFFKKEVADLKELQKQDYTGLDKRLKSLEVKPEAKKRWFEI